MKTPRDILLQRHESVEPKLNAIRHKALAELAGPGLMPPWRAYVCSVRWHLAGLGVVWMAILLLQIDFSPRPRLVVAQGKIPTARVLVAELLRNRRELIELTEAPAADEPAALPPRRSELKPAFEIV